MSKAAAWMVFLAVGGMAADVRAQDRWIAPFGGTWSATFAVMSDYSFRGISLSDRQPAVQAGLGYDLPLVPDRLHLYLEAWGANVSFSPDFSTELTASASVIFYGFDHRLAVELSFSRYSYLEAAPELGANYNEFGLAASYDFGIVRLGGNVNFSPNSYGNAGNAWYKQVELAAPLRFIRLDEVRVTAFATLGNFQGASYAEAGLSNDSYWDWEIGVRARVYGVDLSLSYVDTNLGYADCGNNLGCDARLIAKMSKTF